MKTLRDIKFPKHFQGFTESEVVYVYELKQEAIKRIKFYIKKQVGRIMPETEEDFKNLYKMSTDMNLELKGRIDELMIFFNITEDDLNKWVGKK